MRAEEEVRELIRCDRLVDHRSGRDVAGGIPADAVVQRTLESFEVLPKATILVRGQDVRIPIAYGFAGIALVGMRFCTTT